MNPAFPILKPLQLHIPDGLLSLPVSIVCWLLSAGLLFLAVRRTRDELGERQTPLMGIMAAFIFAAQMVNFPVAGGTSGHLLGGVLAAVTLGPWAGMLVMTSVIIVQGLLFQDGGLVVMGANILNMGLLTVLIGYGLYRFSARLGRGPRLATAGIAAWLSVMAGALATSLQLWLSGTARLDIVAPAMLAVHALIGTGEALITVGALALILRARPDLLEGAASESKRSWGWALAGVFLTLVVLVLSPLAAADPDGLERVATDLNFLGLSRPAAAAILPDYQIPSIGATPLSTILAGGLGALAVSGLAYLIFVLLRRARQA